MKFIWETPPDSATLRAVPEDYDGFPSPAALLMDIAPRLVSGARLAAASVLAFRRYISGQLTLPRQVHPEMASAIENFLAPTTVFISDLNMKPQPIPSGTATFSLTSGFDATRTGPEALGGGRVIALEIESVSDTFASSYSRDRFTVPSNAAMLAKAERSEGAGMLPLLAVAVLLAEDYDVGTVQLPQHVADDSGLDGVGPLLQAAGLRLQLA